MAAVRTNWNQPIGGKNMIKKNAKTNYKNGRKLNAVKLCR